MWNDSGTLRLSHGTDWTNDTTRSTGTALIRVNGIWLNNASIPNGPAASRGTWVGTTRSDGSSQLNWILGGASSGGTAAVLGVWNAYNRVQVATAVSESTSTWSYSSATIRSMTVLWTIASATFVVSLNVSLFVTGRMAAAGAYIDFGWGLNTTTARNSPLLEIYAASYAASVQTTVSGSGHRDSVFNFLQAVEAGDGTNANTVIGSGNANSFKMNWRM